MSKKPNKELIIIAVVLLSSLLFALGGTFWKPLRRFVMPLILTSGGAILGIRWWKCLIALPLLIGANCLGYGEQTPIFMRILTISAFGVALLPMTNKKNWLFVLIVPITFGVNYWVSLNYAWWSWKFVELATGGAFGLVVCLLSLTRRK